MSDRSFEQYFYPFRSRESPTQNRNGIWSSEAQKVRTQPAAYSMFQNSHPMTPHPAHYSSISSSGMSPHGEPLTTGSNSSISSFGNSSLNTPPRDATKYVRPGVSSSARKPLASTSSSANITGSLGDDMTGDSFAFDLEESAEEVVSSLKLQLDALVTAVVMQSEDAGSSSVRALQGADALEIAHRMMTRLRLLREENTRLGQLSSGVLAAQLEAKNSELMAENENLRSQLAELQKKRRTVGM